MCIRGGEAFAAPRHIAPRIALPGFLIELHAQLRGPLEDVKELAERQKEQRGDDGDGVQDREEAVGLTRATTLARR